MSVNVFSYFISNLLYVLPIYTHIYTVSVKLLVLLYTCTCCPPHFFCIMFFFLHFFVDYVNILLLVLCTLVKEFGRKSIQFNAITYRHPMLQKGNSCLWIQSLVQWITSRCELHVHTPSTHFHNLFPVLNHAANWKNSRTLMFQVLCRLANHRVLFAATNM